MLQFASRKTRRVLAGMDTHAGRPAVAYVYVWSLAVTKAHTASTQVRSELNQILRHDIVHNDSNNVGI